MGGLYRISPAARAELDDIWDYLAVNNRRVGIRALRRFDLRRKITCFPILCPWQKRNLQQRQSFLRNSKRLSSAQSNNHSDTVRLFPCQLSFVVGRTDFSFTPATGMNRLMSMWSVTTARPSFGLVRFAWNVAGVLLKRTQQNSKNDRRQPTNSSGELE